MLMASEITNFLKGVITKKVKTYDPSQTKVILAESLILDGIVSVELSELTTSSADTGIDSQYYAVVEQSEGLVLTVNVLPTAQCLSQIDVLNRMAMKNKAFFRVNLIENGEARGAYSAHVIAMGAMNSSLEESSRTIVFGLREKRRKNQAIITTTTNEGVREQYQGNATTYPLID